MIDRSEEPTDAARPQTVAAEVEHLRRLAGSAREKAYFMAESDAVTRMWEAVSDDGGWIAVRQVEMRDGEVRRYWWGRREDDASSLTEGPLPPRGELLLPLTPEAFEWVWAL